MRVNKTFVGIGTKLLLCSRIFRQYVIIMKKVAPSIHFYCVLCRRYFTAMYIHICRYSPEKHDKEITLKNNYLPSH